MSDDDGLPTFLTTSTYTKQKETEQIGNDITITEKSPIVNELFKQATDIVSDKLNKASEADKVSEEINKVLDAQVIVKKEIDAQLKKEKIRNEIITQQQKQQNKEETNNSENVTIKQEEDVECAICLNPCQQPVLLSCSHTFCFLCAKVN